MSVLEEARRVVEQRSAAYGSPDSNLPGYERLAALWSAALGVKISAEQVILCMILMKVSRELGRHQYDNLVDICGYAENLHALLNQRDNLT